MTSIWGDSQDFTQLWVNSKTAPFSLSYGSPSRLQTYFRCYFTKSLAFGISRNIGECKNMIMTIKEKEKLLYRYNELEVNIRDLEDRWEEVYTLSTKITPTYADRGGTSGSFDGSKVENACIKLLEIDLKKGKLIEKKNSIDKALKELTYMQRKVITFVDIEHHSVYACAKSFKRSYNDIKQIRNRALDRMVV